MFLVLAAYPFSSMTANGWPVKAMPGEPTHFAPVFTDRETAEKWNNGRFAIIEIQATKDTKEG